MTIFIISWFLVGYITFKLSTVYDQDKSATNFDWLMCVLYGFISFFMLILSALVSSDWSDEPHDKT